MSCPSASWSKKVPQKNPDLLLLFLFIWGWTVGLVVPHQASERAHLSKRARLAQHGFGTVRVLTSRTPWDLQSGHASRPTASAWPSSGSTCSLFCSLSLSFPSLFFRRGLRAFLRRPARRSSPSHRATPSQDFWGGWGPATNFDNVYSAAVYGGATVDVIEAGAKPGAKPFFVRRHRHQFWTISHVVLTAMPPKTCSML